MLLAISIGNSSIRMGLFDDAGGLSAQRLDTRTKRSAQGYADEIKNFLKPFGGNTPVVIGSVVPGLTGLVSQGARSASGTEPIVVNHTHAPGMKMGVARPDEVGIDRIAVSLAAYEMLGAPVAVIDVGTATTVNFIDEGPVFQGGAIMPGPGLMADALSGGTAQLPALDLCVIADPLGLDTGSAMLSGIIFGTAGAVLRIVGELNKTRDKNYLIAVTGGYAGLILPHLAGVSLADGDLALKGLRIMYKGRA